MLVVGSELHVHPGVVLQVLPHLGDRGHHLDAALAQLVRVTDAGQHEQPGAVERARRDDHLAACSEPLRPGLGLALDADGLPRLDQHSADHQMRADLQVGA